jgi:hypothetical protein
MTRTEEARAWIERYQRVLECFERYADPLDPEHEEADVGRAAYFGYLLGSEQIRMEKGER